MATVDAQLKLIRARPGDLVVVEMAPGIVDGPEVLNAVLRSLPEGVKVLALLGTKVTNLSRADWRRVIAESKEIENAG